MLGAERQQRQQRLAGAEGLFAEPLQVESAVVIGRGLDPVAARKREIAPRVGPEMRQQVAEHVAVERPLVARRQHHAVERQRQGLLGAEPAVVRQHEPAVLFVQAKGLGERMDEKSRPAPDLVGIGAAVDALDQS